MLTKFREAVTFSAILFICTISCAAELSSDNFPENNLIQNDCAGNIKIGMTIDELYSVVGKDNAKLIDAYTEGMFSPTIAIYKTAKQKNITMYIAVASKSNDFVVDSIEVFDDSYATTKGVGVNSRLGEIKASYRISRIIETDGGVIVTLDKHQLSASFKLERVKSVDSSSYQDTLRVKSILVY